MTREATAAGQALARRDSLPVSVAYWPAVRSAKCTTLERGPAATPRIAGGGEAVPGSAGIDDGRADPQGSRRRGRAQEKPAPGQNSCARSRARVRARHRPSAAPPAHCHAAKSSSSAAPVPRGPRRTSPCEAAGRFAEWKRPELQEQTVEHARRRCSTIHFAAAAAVKS